ncbi:MAG: tRNA pseudouridine(55) synthase TruB [Spirochaetia bacterium]|nr:tRNA pseudouridine(55) synthase TruB [Spirochaetia bacterium]
MIYNKNLWKDYLPVQTGENYAPVEKSGILNIDKPTGLSSMDVIRIIRKIGKIKKVGHAGTLDPLATGVLPILVNKATKLSETLMSGSKEYDGTLIFGQEYDTQDITGTPIGKTSDLSPDINLEFLKNAASFYKGEIDQIPPIFSAIKKNGKPLYKYARSSQIVDIQTRKVFVDTFNIVEQINSNTFSFYISCGKGVYVRTLVHDLGIRVQCPAALASLRRLRVGKFLFENTVKLEHLKTPDDIIDRLISPEL